MNNPTKIGISIGVIATIIVIAIMMSNTNSGSMEVEDVLDKELKPDKESPEIQAKLDDIEKTAEENKEKIESSEYDPNRPREWLTSGPFQIDRSKYVLGEKIFLVMGSLGYEEKGEIVFLRPLNETHYSVYQTIPFDGVKKDVFNYYISPQLSASKSICSIDDLVGNWIISFRGTDYPNIKFEITDDILPGDEEDYNNSVC